MPRGVGVDPPGPGARVQNVRQRTSTQPSQPRLASWRSSTRRSKRTCCSVLAWPCRWSVASHTVEGKAADGLPAESQPVAITLRLGQVENLLPEPGQLLDVVALQDELGERAHSIPPTYAPALLPRCAPQVIRRAAVCGPLWGWCGTRPSTTALSASSTAA
jgi:hypothetical protein